MGLPGLGGSIPGQDSAGASSSSAETGTLAIEDTPDDKSKLHTQSSKVKTIKHTLKDGTKLCPDFQKGTCKKGVNCPKGKHLCGAVEKSGRVCGGRHSPGLGKCTNKKVVRK